LPFTCSIIAHASLPLDIEMFAVKQIVVTSVQQNTVKRRRAVRNNSLTTNLRTTNAYKIAFYQYFCHRPKIKNPYSGFPPPLGWYTPHRQLRLPVLPRKPNRYRSIPLIHPHSISIPVLFQYCRLQQ